MLSETTVFSLFSGQYFVSLEEGRNGCSKRGKPGDAGGVCPLLLPLALALVDATCLKLQHCAAFCLSALPPAYPHAHLPARSPRPLPACPLGRPPHPRVAGYLSVKPCGSPDVVDAWPVKDHSGRQVLHAAGLSTRVPDASTAQRGGRAAVAAGLSCPLLPPSPRPCAVVGPLPAQQAVERQHHRPPDQRLRESAQQLQRLGSIYLRADSGHALVQAP